MRPAHAGGRGDCVLNPVLWLRAAAVVTFIHAVMHTVGGVLSKPLPGVATMVANTMRDHRFDVFGASRSYSDFYLGLGLNITIYLLVGAVMMWQLGTLAQSSALAIRPLVIVLAIGYGLLAVVSQRYFFWGPAVAEIVIVFCLVMAFAGAKHAALR